MPQRDAIRGNKMIWMGVSLALSFWIIEALIHAFIFHEHGFGRDLFPDDPNELWMRSLVCILLIGFGTYAHIGLVKYKKSEMEREQLQRRLEESLTKVLSGFLPICANCKNIRDERSNWIQIEGYIQSHSEAKFSHGICPKCAKVLYPDYSANDKVN
jgi:hypothetical protein